MKPDRTWIPLMLIAALGLAYGVRVRLADAREANVCRASSYVPEADFGDIQRESVAQTDSAPFSKIGGCGFDSRPARQIAAATHKDSLSVALNYPASPDSCPAVPDHIGDGNDMIPINHPLTSNVNLQWPERVLERID